MPFLFSASDISSVGRSLRSRGGGGGGASGDPIIRNVEYSTRQAQNVNSDVVYGMRFTVTEPLQATAFRAYLPSPPRPVPVALWYHDGSTVTRIAEAEIASSPDEWVIAPLPTPVALSTSATRYTVGFGLESRDTSDPDHRMYRVNATDPDWGLTNTANFDPRISGISFRFRSTPLVSPLEVEPIESLSWLPGFVDLLIYS